MLDNSSRAETKELLSYLYQLSKIFHENHYFILEVKRRIMENISEILTLDMMWRVVGTP